MLDIQLYQIRKEKRENSNQNEKFHKVVLNWLPRWIGEKAQYYRNERIKSMTDEKYGEGTADFLAQAIEAFYK